MKIVQCVPNISEGRDLAKIERIITPLKSVEGVKLISVEPDADYNRTVITLLGNPENMIEPLIEFINLAKKEIDMNLHFGEHPRMGAVDVIPFIPISNVEMTECIEYAKKLGELVFNKLAVPVFLYAEAATKKSRVSLPNIRKGEFEGLKDKIKEEIWTPDYGKNEIHPTFGAVAIGARLPLIAYNIDINTDKQNIANNIAKAIRKSNGGFAYVQAGPAFLQKEGHMQVTMNILDYKKNPLYRVLETVKMEAKRYDVDVLSSEVVGLIPKETILNSLKYYLAVDKKAYKEDFTLKEISELAIKYIGFRDFNVNKIIEANLGDDNNES